MGLLYIILVIYILTCISLYFLFPKVNVEAWKALVPGINFIEWCKLIGRPTWWPLLLLIPLVNIFIWTGMAVNLVRSFDRFGLWESALAVFFPPAIFGILATSDTDTYQGPILTRERNYMADLTEANKSGHKRKIEKLTLNNPYKKSLGREWLESIFFAVFAAAFIRMFLIEPYLIPTPSMEGSLNVGDFLFVSKAHYGIRTPSTIAMIPLLHNRIPGLGVESYLKSPKLKSHRLKPITPIKRFDPIVFNWPVGDSVYITSTRSYTVAQVRRGGIGDPELPALVKDQAYVVRPFDKKDHYVKRCIALPGDTLEIRDKEIYIDGVFQPRQSHIQHNYQVAIPSGFNSRKLLEWGIDEDDLLQRGTGSEGQPVFYYALDAGQAEKLTAAGAQVQVLPQGGGRGGALFPHDANNYNDWTVDDFGPIWMPKKGATVQLSPSNISLYRRVITSYEGHELKTEGGQYIIDGQASTSYTFEQDYYWGMGDNRHNSEDSRAWGFVPADHIVGKPLFIWFSTKDGGLFSGVNWDRIFMSASKACE